MFHYIFAYTCKCQYSIGSAEGANRFYVFLSSEDCYVNSDLWSMLTEKYVAQKKTNTKVLNKSLPVTTKTPPIIPQSRTKNCQKGWCCSLTRIFNEFKSYLKNMPETPWLPLAWFIVLFWKDTNHKNRINPVLINSSKGNKERSVHL